MTMFRTSFTTIAFSLILLANAFLPIASYAQSTTPTTTQQATGGGYGDAFTSLTQLPGIPEVSNAASLPDFFNNLYRLCIGAAAVIAVLQIMRAGVKFMTKGGSVSSNQEAKDMIQNAIIGLVLVLSPAIVFGIINPRILNLELDLGGLQPADLKDVDLTAGSSAQERMCSVSEKFQVLSFAIDEHRVDAQGNRIDSVNACRKLLGSGWARKDTYCCASKGTQVGTGQQCCGFDSSDVEPPAPPSETGNGNYSYEYVVREEDYGNGGFCRVAGSRDFATEAKCISDVNSSVKDGRGAIRSSCKVNSGGAVAYFPSEGIYNQLNSLPLCNY